MSCPSHEGRSVSSETFQSIIKERKENRKKSSEQIHAINKQRILDMKSKVGIDPLDRFPKEVWKMIMDHLSAKDKGSVCEVHEMFQGLMSNSRIAEILFPQILGEKVRLASTFEFITWRSFAHFNNLRGVCKSLRNAIDSYYERNLMREMRLENNDTISNTTRLHFSLPDFQKLRQIIEKCTSGPENERPKRFYCRSLLVCFTTRFGAQSRGGLQLKDIVTQFTKDVTTFIELFGDQIWKFHFDYSDLGLWRDSVGVSLPQIYTIFHGWLMHMPNLKWLKYDLEILEQDANCVPHFLKEQPIPSLTHLERIDFSCDMNPICKAVLSANQHVKILKWAYDRRYWDLLNTFPSLNLEVISIHGFDINRIWPKWPLQTLKLKIYANQNICSVNSIFEFLHSFPTLESLNLKISDFLFRGYLPFLRLPNLSHLKLILPESTQYEWNQNLNFLFSLQFLLYCGKLKSLDWTNECFDMEKFRNNIEKYDSPEKINFGGGWQDLSKSNMWKVFPSLYQVRLKLFERSCVRGKMCNKIYYKGDLVYLRFFEFQIHS